MLYFEFWNLSANLWVIFYVLEMMLQGGKFVMYKSVKQVIPKFRGCPSLLTFFGAPFMRVTPTNVDPNMLLQGEDYDLKERANDSHNLRGQSAMPKT